MKRLPELASITAFLTVAEELNFRRAAERLAVDQTALSRRIKALERQLGYQLLHRTTHDVRLTAAGEAFHDANRNLVAGLAAAVERGARIASGQSGHLRIAYMTFAAVELMPAAVREFGIRHPHVGLSLDYQPTQAQKLSLARGEVDVGLMLGPFEHSDFETLVLSEEGLVLIAPEGHPLARAEAPSLAEVGRQPLVLGTDRQWDFYRARIDEIFAARGICPRVAFQAPSLFGILGLVRAGLGVTLVPEAMLGFCPKGLAARRVADADAPMQSIAAWRRPAEGMVREFVADLSRMARVRPARG